MLGVVMYPIQNGTDRKSTEWWSEYSLQERTQAIYNNIRRLDEAPPKRIVVPLAKKGKNKSTLCCRLGQMHNRADARSAA